MAAAHSAVPPEPGGPAAPWPRVPSGAPAAHSRSPVAAAALAPQAVDAKRWRTRCVVVLAAVLEPLAAAHWPAPSPSEASRRVPVASADRLVASAHGRLELASRAALRVARWLRAPEVRRAQHSEAARFAAVLRWAVVRRAPSPGAVDPSLRVVRFADPACLRAAPKAAACPAPSLQAVNPSLRVVRFADLASRCPSPKAAACPAPPLRAVDPSLPGVRSADPVFRRPSWWVAGHRVFPRPLPAHRRPVVARRSQQAAQQ